MPVAGTPAAGLNCTISVTPSLGFKVTGKMAPDTVKPEPLIVAELIVSGAVPVEVSVTGNAAEEPSSTVPKLKLAGLTVNCVPVSGTPLQVRLTASPLCLTALLFIVSVPVIVLAAFGADVTLSVTACLGLSVTGKATPDTVNPAPVIDRAVIINGAVPVEVSVTGNVAVDPTVTLPKFRLAGLTASCGVV